MRLATLVITASLLVLSPSVLAQDSEPEDEVVATGTIRTDRAMSAFLSGDFETAEIEFDKNFVCARRAERNFRSGVEAARDSFDRPDANVGQDTVAQPTGGPGGATAQAAPDVTPQVRVNSRDFERSDKDPTRTCEDIGFQLYMRGLSQIKLGKFEEGYESLSRSVVYRKDIYDAYYRLALLDFQSGDLDAARKNLKGLKTAQRRCRTCDGKEDMDAKVQYVENLLN